MVDEIKRTQPRLVRDRESLDYLHQESALAKRELNAYQAYCRMTENSSWLMRSAVWLRDALCKPFGVEQIGGFRNKSADAPPKVGEKLDFFLVEDISDRRLVLTVRDRHLDVMLSLTADPVAEGGTLVGETTSVVTHNFFGRLYMVPVAPAHHVIVRRDMKKLAA